MKKIAILQSNYIPWKGYFDLINMVDEFILFDNALYTKNDWRNRNIIKTQDGLKRITIPVRKKSSGQKINESLIANNKWHRKHWNALKTNYGKAGYFSEYSKVFEELYLKINSGFLSEINYYFIINICEILDIKTRITWSADYELINGKTERLVSICQQANATHYLSGLAAKSYIDESLFNEAGIVLEWMDYSKYPEYNQLFPPFEHGVSILDLIFNVGPNFRKYLKSY